jgi:hypothetical protein
LDRRRPGGESCVKSRDSVTGDVLSDAAFSSGLSARSRVRARGV